MKKKRFLVGLAWATLGAATAWVMADPVRDWRDLQKVHEHVGEAIHEMDHARAANHYDMAGHGAKAEELLRQAERELQLAVQVARSSP